MLILLAQGQKDQWQAHGDVRLNHSFSCQEPQHLPHHPPHIACVEADSVLPMLLRHVRWLLSEAAPPQRMLQPWLRYEQYSVASKPPC